MPPSWLSGPLTYRDMYQLNTPPPSYALAPDDRHAEENNLHYAKGKRVITCKTIYFLFPYTAIVFYASVQVSCRTVAKDNKSYGSADCPTPDGYERFSYKRKSYIQGYRVISPLFPFAPAPPSSFAPIPVHPITPGRFALIY